MIIGASAYMRIFFEPDVTILDEIDTAKERIIANALAIEIFPIQSWEVPIDIFHNYMNAYYQLKIDKSLPDDVNINNAKWFYAEIITS